MTEIPDTAKEIIEAMPAAFDPEKAPDLEATFQFELSGEGGGTWVIDIANGSCEVREGPVESPSVIIGMSAADYVAMAKKELDQIKAFMAGRIQVKGDINLALKFDSLFPR
jgi:putative sterol carrier protein